VQAFVSRDEMTRHLGDHRPAAVARASVYGMVSSSCSYAASALSRSLFARGADFVAAMVFMFASTNLVVELGIVLAVLIGWQFVAAELVGGVIMIVLLVVAGGFWFRGRALVEARATSGAADRAAHDRAAHDDATGGADRLPWRRRIRSGAGWSDAATYTLSDLGMLRREMAIGFVVAGFLTILVPTHMWNDVFIHGHGSWTTLENAVVGPFVAIISFVCSIGNVPLAAALWSGGISFGGVVSFVFADLVTLPLLLIYRKQYGRRMALRMLGVFWLVMSMAGLATEGLFHLTGLVPDHRRRVVTGDTLRFNYTTVLDVVALVLFAAVIWLSRHRERFGGGSGYAIDPVCGMQVEIAHAPASSEQGTHRAFFCSDHCRERFDRDPTRHLGVDAPAGSRADTGPG
jgi:uncharacterized membrane protein YraQ (UPF0718 family)/YHS domain-containing protein